MAKKFKDYYNSSCAELLGRKLNAFNSEFDADGFKSHVAKGIRGREFFDRLDVFNEALKFQYRDNYQAALRDFRLILGSELKTETGMFTYGWWLWPIGRFVEKNAHYHLNHLTLSLDFIQELTKRFTGEFAIRPLLKTQPNQVIPVMQKWAQDPSVHVRRLASEGLRPRLPWAKKSSVFVENFDECAKVLSLLKKSPEKFVQKSVGNCLNDLYKEAPERADELVHAWLKAESLGLEDLRQKKLSPLLWIIRHGRRSLQN